MLTITATVVSQETIKDDTKTFQVYSILVRQGMKSWKIKRKYGAFLSLQELLSRNSQIQAHLPESADHEKTAIEAYMAEIFADEKHLKIDAVRKILNQFFEVPKLYFVDSSQDSTRSLLSVPLTSLIPNNSIPTVIPARTDLLDVLILTVSLIFLN